jgi:hypothetical protein
MKKLKVAFIIDNTIVDHYVGDIIEFVENNELFEDPILITGYLKSKKKSFKQKIISTLKRNIFRTIDVILKLLLFKIIHKIEYNHTIKKFPNYGKKIDCNKCLKVNLIKVEGEWSKSGIYLNFSSSDLQKISSANIDCIIRCGSGVLKGKILDIAPLGVLSFHHGDNRYVRGGPSGFWEVLHNQHSSGFIIQKLDNKLDAGDVLVRGNLMTQKFWLLNNAQLLEKSNYFLKDILKKVAINNLLPEPEKMKLYNNKIFKIKSSLPLFKYFIKILLPPLLNNIFFILKIKEFFFGKLVERWSVAFAEHNNFSRSLSDYKEIKNPKGRFLADPFVIKKNDINYIFVEDFCYSSNKGSISVISLKDNNYKFMGVVLKEDFHLSFPFVFEWEKEIFMIPETSQIKEIRLYKCEVFPMKWKLDTVLMKNVDSADTMLIYLKNKWFMLTNICSAGIGNHESELHIFFSENLRSNNWQPIKSGNPVIFDSLKARNGGIIIQENVMYRVNQIQKKNNYGASFEINKVNYLSTEKFSETKILTTNPNFKKDLIGTHHFNANNEVAVIDYRKKSKPLSD